jgi:hypothetical protein
MSHKLFLIVVRFIGAIYVPCALFAAMMTIFYLPAMVRSIAEAGLYAVPMVLYVGFYAIHAVIFGFISYAFWSLRNWGRPLGIGFHGLYLLLVVALVAEICSRSSLDVTAAGIVLWSPVILYLASVVLPLTSSTARQIMVR